VAQKKNSFTAPQHNGKKNGEWIREGKGREGEMIKRREAQEQRLLLSAACCNRA
jgi:hypothetical protein